MGFYAKKIFQTAPVTSVTESTLESNSDVNVPTIKAVVDGIKVRQLLINNDFLSWQRGANIDQGTGLTYTADMWFLNIVNNISRVEKVKNEAKVCPNQVGANGAFGQIVETSLNSNKVVLSFTARATENVECYCRIAKANSDVSNEEIQPYSITTEKKRFIFYFDIDKNNDKTIIEIIRFWNDKLSTNASVYISEVDLFEGNIAYTHVKENYVIALLKCSEYIKTLNLSTIDLIKTWGIARNSMLSWSINFDIPFKNNVTISEIEISNIYSDNNTEANDISLSDIILDSYVSSVSHDRFVMTIKKKNNGLFDRNYNYFVNIKKPIIITCEPL